MTRQKFIDDIDDFYNLIEFCEEHNCDYCEDIYDEGARDDFINESLRDIASEADGWEDLYRTLDSITTGYDWYLREYGYTDWTGLTYEDFEEYKTDVLDWADANDVWEEDEEQALDEEDDEDDDFVVEEEPISISELIGACNSQLCQITENKKSNAQADDEVFEVFVKSCVTIAKGE